MSTSQHRAAPSVIASGHVYRPAAGSEAGTSCSQRGTSGGRVEVELGELHQPRVLLVLALIRQRDLHAQRYCRINAHSEPTSPSLADTSCISYHQPSVCREATVASAPASLGR